MTDRYGAVLKREVRRLVPWTFCLVGRSNSAKQARGPSTFFVMTSFHSLPSENEVNGRSPSEEFNLKLTVVGFSWARNVLLT